MLFVDLTPIKKLNILKKISKIVLKGKNGRPVLCDVRGSNTDQEQPLIIFCHGFKGYKDWGHFNLIADELACDNYIVLKFNFSHNGGTIEDPIDFPDLAAFGENDYIKELNDLEVVLDALDEGVISADFPNWNKQTYLLGHSRGGGIAIIKAFEDKRIHKVATWASVSNFIARLPNSKNLKRWETAGVYWVKNGRTLQDMPMYYNFVEILYRYKDRLNIQVACENMAIPQLVVHGSADEAVKFKEGKELQFWNKNAVFVEIADAGHTFGGKHPFEEKELPMHSKVLVEKTIDFFDGQ